MAASGEEGRLTGLFLEQHELLQRGARLLARHSAYLGQGADVDPALLHQFLHFFRSFLLDHQALEERVLLPWLSRQGVSEGALANLLAEHLRARRDLADLAGCVGRLVAESAADRSREEYEQRAEAFAVALAAHDWKENHILYPLADLIDEQEELVARGTEEAGWAMDRAAARQWIEDIEALALNWPDPAVTLPFTGDGDVFRRTRRNVLGEER